VDPGSRQRIGSVSLRLLVDVVLGDDDQRRHRCRQQRVDQRQCRERARAEPERWSVDLTTWRALGERKLPEHRDVSDDDIVAERQRSRLLGGFYGRCDINDDDDDDDDDEQHRLADRQAADDAERQRQIDGDLSGPTCQQRVPADPGQTSRRGQGQAQDESAGRADRQHHRRYSGRSLRRETRSVSDEKRSFSRSLSYLTPRRIPADG